MSGQHDAPMPNRPFDLIRVTVTDAPGKPRFQRPLWLLVLGSRRRELALVQAYQAYCQRYDLEIFEVGLPGRSVAIEYAGTPGTGAGDL